MLQRRLPDIRRIVGMALRYPRERGGCRRRWLLSRCPLLGQVLSEALRGLLLGEVPVLVGKLPPRANLGHVPELGVAVRLGNHEVTIKTNGLVASAE